MQSPFDLANVSFGYLKMKSAEWHATYSVLEAQISSIALLKFKVNCGVLLGFWGLWILWVWAIVHICKMIACHGEGVPRRLSINCSAPSQGFSNGKSSTLDVAVQAVILFDRVELTQRSAICILKMSNTAGHFRLSLLCKSQNKDRYPKFSAFLVTSLFGAKTNFSFYDLATEGIMNSTSSHTSGSQNCAD